MLQASLKFETPRLELKSWRTFLAIKRCQRTKIRKVIKLAQSSKKSGRRYATTVVKLLTVKEIVEAQKADSTLKQYFKCNAVLDNGLELLFIEKESCICHKGRLVLP
jgi:hypothetical protein